MLSQKQEFENYRFTRTILLNQYRFILKISICGLAGRGRGGGIMLIFSYTNTNFDKHNSWPQMKNLIKINIFGKKTVIFKIIDFHGLFY